MSTSSDFRLADWPRVPGSALRMAFAALAVALVLLPWRAVAQPAPISPRRLVEVVDIVAPVVSPDGRKVAFRTEQASIERNDYITSWYVQALEGAAPARRVADGGTPLRRHSSGLTIPEVAVWSPDSSAIYYKALVDGQVAVWRAAADGSHASPVASGPADVREFILSEDGATLRFSTGATREDTLAAELAEYDRGVHIDETVFIGAGLFRSSQMQGRAASQKFQGQWFEAGPLLGNVAPTWHALDLATGKVRDLAPDVVGAPAQPPQHLDAWKWARNARDGRFAVLSRTGEAEGRFAKPDVALSVWSLGRRNAAVKCPHPLCTDKNITAVQWRPGRDEVMLTVTDRQQGRAQAIYRWDVVQGTVSEVVRARGIVQGYSTQQGFTDVPCGVSAQALVCVAAEADGPPRLERIELESGLRTVLFEPNAALAQDIAVTMEAQLLRWNGDNGEVYSGWFFPAQGQGPKPLFVTYYVCDGFLRGGIGDEWPLMTLAGHGISALCINGNPGYLDVVRYYDQGRFAVEGAVAELARRGLVDPIRVGMGGLSHGGEITMWTLMRSNVVSAASIASLSLTPNWYLFNSLRKEFREGVMSNWQLATPQETPGQWKTMSPAMNLDRFQAPILFQMPEQEYLMATDYTLPLVRERRADMYVFPDEPHIKFKPRHKLAAYERNVDWFRFWLQGFEDNDPQKTEQYQHWRLMRSGRCEPATAATETPWYCRAGE